MSQARDESRHLSLDAIRGIAVMGILAMNIIAFSMPQAAYLNPLAYGGSSALDLGVWAFNFVLVDGKMRGFFSLLFGASMLLVIQGAEAKGENGVALHLRRMAWLAVFGLAHYYLLWFGDILFLYAIIGMVAFLFRAREPGNLVKWAVIVLVINALLWALMCASFLALQYAATQPGADAGLVASYRGLLPGLGQPGNALSATELRVYSGDYGGILAERTGRGAIVPFVGLLLNGVETLGFMLLGMALFKNGFLTGQWERARYRRTALICYTIGLPVMIALAAWCFASGFDTIATFTSMFGWATPVRPVLIVAHAALALLLVTRFAESALVKRIAAAGRAAFTNYLGTNLVMTTIFYGYGLGLFGEIGRAQAYLFVFGMWALMLLWSKPWLDRFQYGPLEWLWRSLARGRIADMRKPLATASH